MIVLLAFSCKKDNQVKPIDPTEEVVLTVKLSFQYFSSDVSIKKVFAFLRLSEESSIIVSANADLSGRPATYDLVLRLSGQAAKKIIDKKVHLNTKVVYMIGEEEVILEANSIFIIWGGEQTREFNYEIVPVKKIVCVVHKNFAYGSNVVLLLVIGAISDSQDNFLGWFRYEEIEDTPERMSSTIIIEGQVALQNIGKELRLVVEAHFRRGESTFKKYWQDQYFIAQEGEQEFEFNFAHPPSAGDE